VATLTLDEAESRNALSAAILDGLGDGLATAMGDDRVRVVVLANEGNTFCAGADLKGGGPAPRVGLPEVLTAMLDGPKPVVGKITGHCMGGGVGLAAACDLSVVADDARFGFTEVRIGVAPAIISVVCLPKLRPADAAELFLTGRRITAARAAEVGLVNRVAPAEEVAAVVDSLVDELLAGGPRALAAVKGLIGDVPGMARDEAFARTAELSARLFASDEAAEGIAAFREGRPARWVP
jgi:methylglutaconyl-CoA hydratase